MMGILKKIYWIIPSDLRRKLENILKYSSRTNLTNRIINYYEKKSQLITPEVKEVIDFLKINWVCPFPYAYKQEYGNVKVEVYKDNNTGLLYVFHNKHKMFFRESMTVNQVANNYRALLAEQDERSPHRYVTSSFFPNENDIIIDVGAAEGIFSLDHIEKAKKIYLIEPNPEWIKSLYYTFKAWGTKVEIIPKFASNNSTDTTVSLDDLCEDEVNFIKIDVEGYEKKVMEGSLKLLGLSSKLKICLCTYHKQEDADFFSKFLVNHKFAIEFSKGFMLSIYPKESKAPYLRRGLIRAQRL